MAVKLIAAVLMVPLILPNTVPPTYKFPPIPTPPVITTAPLVVLVDTELSENKLFPLAICTEYVLDMDTFEPATGGPVIYNVAALVAVIKLDAASVICPNVIELAFETVPAPKTLSVKVTAGELKIMPRVLFTEKIPPLYDVPTHIFFAMPNPPDKIILPVIEDEAKVESVIIRGMLDENVVLVKVVDATPDELKIRVPDKYLLIFKSIYLFIFQI